MLITVTLMAIFFASFVQSFELGDRNYKIVGGQPARANQFPHAVALILHLAETHSLCGGSIIHQNYVLTAAHCLDDIVEIEVLAGLNNIFTGTPLYKRTVEPRDIRVHPQYNRQTMINDIGIVFLLNRIPLGTSMQRIALPQRSQINNRFVGSIGTIIGWGRTSDTSAISLTDALRFVQLPIIADQRCNEVYNVDYRFFNPTNICLSGERGSSCNGDSGSGLHVNLEDERTIIGIISFGSETCATGHPPVMTRITSYLDWISANTGVRIN